MGAAGHRQLIPTVLEVRSMGCLSHAKCPYALHVYMGPVYIRRYGHIVKEHVSRLEYWTSFGVYGIAKRNGLTHAGERV